MLKQSTLEKVKLEELVVGSEASTQAAQVKLQARGNVTLDELIVQLELLPTAVIMDP